MGDFGQGAQGAVGGGATGFALGGPVGGLVGAGIGGLLGYFGDSGPSQEDFDLPGFEDRRDRLNQDITDAGQRGAPTANAAQIGGFQRAGLGGPFRGGQQQLIGQLQQQAQGLGPSLATGQFDRSLQQGIAAQQAQANTGVGNQALAGRQAAQNIGGITQDLAGQAAQARIQEQMGARQQLAGVLGTARGQELAGSQFDAGQFNQRRLAQAGFNQQTGLANLGADLQNRNQQNQFGMGLRELELANASGQQQGRSGFAGSQGPGLGSQILGGGGAGLAQGIAQGFGALGNGGGGGGQGGPVGDGLINPFA
jgi:hypothetical protein